MTKVNRVDSLSSELRDIKRRLHALETALGAVTTRAAASATTTATTTAAGSTAAAVERSSQPSEPEGDGT